MKLCVLPGLVLALSLVGCASIGPAQVDVLSKLLLAAELGDPGHPDGENVVLMHFSHLGQVTTVSGEKVYVADRRAVIAGMLAPRGKNAILFLTDAIGTSANSNTCKARRCGARARGCLFPAISTAFSIWYKAT